MSASPFDVTETGIVVPKRKAIQCGYCPRPIFREHEPSGKLKVVNGRPMCPTCRVTKLDPALGKEILRDRKDYEQDKRERTKFADQRETERVADIAAKSVEASGTENTELRKRKGL